jgi:hypothetical protein
MNTTETIQNGAFHCSNKSTVFSIPLTVTTTGTVDTSLSASVWLFKSTGTIQFPSDTLVNIECIGAGAGGANSIGISGNLFCGGGGGGGGVYTHGSYTCLAGVIYPVIVGLGGTGGSGSYPLQYSGKGGQSSFNYLIKANGGLTAQSSHSGTYISNPGNYPRDDTGLIVSYYNYSLSSNQYYGRGGQGSNPSQNKGSLLDGMAGAIFTISNSDSYNDINCCGGGGGSSYADSHGFSSNAYGGATGNRTGNGSNATFYGGGGGGGANGNGGNGYSGAVYIWY